MVSPFAVFILATIFSASPVRRKLHGNLRSPEPQWNATQESSVTSNSPSVHDNYSHVIQKPTGTIDTTRSLDATGTSLTLSVSHSHVTAVLGLYLLYALFQYTLRAAWSLFRRKLTFSVTIFAPSDLYYEVLHQVKQKLNDHVWTLNAIPESRSPKLKDPKYSLQYEPGFGYTKWMFKDRPGTWRDLLFRDGHWRTWRGLRFPDGHWIHFSHSQGLVFNTELSDKGFIRLTCIGRSSTPLKEFLQKCTEEGNRVWQSKAPVISSRPASRERGRGGQPSDHSRSSSTASLMRSFRPHYSTPVQEEENVESSPDVKTKPAPFECENMRESRTFRPLGSRRASSSLGRT